MMDTEEEIRAKALIALQQQRGKSLNCMPEDLKEETFPLALDLMTFTMWLRHSSDFFGGPRLDNHFPRHDNPEFTEVLADLALIYTGE